MKKISVIIPIYNTVQYLPKCLISICNQTYKNLEIICIDDGSTDGSQVVVDEFAQKDNRIIVIHQVNGGESNARNTALKIMTGDFIAFCDSDDWIESDMFEILVKKMEENEIDLVITNFYEDSDNKSIKMENNLKISAEVFGRDELFKYIFIRDSYKGFAAYMWNKLYKKELFYDNNDLLLFDETLKMALDVLYFTRLASKVKRAYYVPDAYYHYFQRCNSAVHTKKIELRIDHLKVYQKIIEMMETDNIETDILVWVKRFLAYLAKNATIMAYEQKNQEAFLLFKNIMEKYKNEYIETNAQYKDRVEDFYNVLCLDFNKRK